MVGGETSLSGNDDSSLPLGYTPGYEQLYINGVLMVRGQDYTATTGTTVTGLTALTVNDVVEVFSVLARTVADVYTQAQADAKYATKTNFPDGAWISYTPTFTGLTTSGASYTVSAKYQRIGKTVTGRVKVTVTSGNPVTGGVTFTLPVTAADTTTNEAIIGNVMVLDFLSQYYPGYTMGLSTTTAGIFVGNATSTYFFINALSASVPMTWATGDFFSAEFTYEAA
jgi:phage baseplate assembly protein gpV